VVLKMVWQGGCRVLVRFGFKHPSQRLNKAREASRHEKCMTLRAIDSGRLTCQFFAALLCATSHPINHVMVAKMRMQRNRLRA